VNYSGLMLIQGRKIRKVGAESEKELRTFVCESVDFRVTFTIDRIEFKCS